MSRLIGLSYWILLGLLCIFFISVAWDYSKILYVKYCRYSRIPEEDICVIITTLLSLVCITGISKISLELANYFPILFSPLVGRLIPEDLFFLFLILIAGILGRIPVPVFLNRLKRKYVFGKRPAFKSQATRIKSAG